MKIFLPSILFIVLVLSGCKFTSVKNETFCNPVNLSYRFQLDEPSRREAADPSVVCYKGDYFMFLSKSGGYYHSNNMIDWELIETKDLPVEEYAPTAININDTVYFMALNQKIYQSSNPISGKWDIKNDSIYARTFDPTIFRDEDGRMYLYHGLSARTPIKGIELDRESLQPIGEEADLLVSNRKYYGWERRGDYNTDTKKRAWVEGAFVTKHNNKYYLHYSVPGTQFKSYGDGMYVSENPLGPFNLAEINPFSYKPEGFIAGAGHGSVFNDEFGNYWYAGTMTVAVKHRLERRIGMFPAFFDEDGCFYAYTGFGDYPHAKPQGKMNSYKDYKPLYMLLSYNKPVEVSSSFNDHQKENCVDENIKTSWSALSGRKGEWLMIDLEEEKDVHALQINFADVDTKIFGRPQDIYYQYLIEYSNDKKNWTVLIDKTNNIQDAPHDYIELDSSVKGRYIRITNYKVPDGKFAISGFRVFGFGNGKKPDIVDQLTVKRNPDDGCVVDLKWNKNPKAIGYNIRYGTNPEKLYLNYQVYDCDSLSIRSLNSKQDYYFTIDAFNENGITMGEDVLKSAKNIE